MLRFLISVITICLASMSIVHAQINRPVSGVVAFTSGDIRVSYQDDQGQVIGRSAGIGDPIFLNDEITTGPETNLQILLKDQTVFNIGPNAAIIFDEFVYDPNDAEASSLSATITKGTFKFISGKIASQKPENVALKLPNATASIRGTTVAGRVKDEGESDVILLSGAIAVSSPSAPEPVDIFTSGWGTSISNDGLIDAPFPVPIETLDAILEEVTIDITALRAAAAGVTAETDGGDGDGDDQSVAVGPVLTPETVETIEDIVTLVTAEVSSDESGNLNVGDLAAYISANGLAEQLGLSEADLSYEDLNGLNIESQLLGYLISGQTPLFLTVQDDGGNTYSLVNPPSSAGEQLNLYNQTYAGLVSNAYSGGATFTKSGLALATGSTTVTVPQSYNSQGFATFTSNLQGSGTVDYTVNLNYETTAVTGSISVNNLVINAQTYADHSGNINVANMSSAAGGEAAGIELYNVANLSGSGGDSADIEFNGSFASISDGTNTIDGLIGSFHAQVYNTSSKEFVEISSDPSVTRSYVSEFGEGINFDTSAWNFNGSNNTFTLASDSNVSYSLEGNIPVNSDGDVWEGQLSALNQITDNGQPVTDDAGNPIYTTSGGNPVTYYLHKPEIIPTLSVEQYQVGTAN